MKNITFHQFVLLQEFIKLKLDPSTAPAKCSVDCWQIIDFFLSPLVTQKKYSGMLSRGSYVFVYHYYLHAHSVRNKSLDGLYRVTVEYLQFIIFFWFLISSPFNGKSSKIYRFFKTATSLDITTWACFLFNLSVKVLFNSCVKRLNNCPRKIDIASWLTLL